MHASYSYKTLSDINASLGYDFTTGSSVEDAWVEYFDRNKNISLIILINDQDGKKTNLYDWFLGDFLFILTLSCLSLCGSENKHLIRKRVQFTQMHTKKMFDWNALKNCFF